jgi:uncharacterized protein (UPF0333 family)
MMIKENRGQVALEYMLIFAISLILLVVFTLPLAEVGIEDTMDVSDTLKVKSDMSRLSHAIKEVYGQGQGSRQTINIDSSHEIKVNVANNYISCNLKLKDGTNKIIKLYFTSTLEKSNFYIHEGENSIIVDWPESGENMRIHQ